MRLLSGLLKRFVEKGRLTVIDTTGARSTFGSGEDGPSVTAKLHDGKTAGKLFWNPELAFPEAYMDGRISFEEGSTVYDLLLLFSLNRKALGGHPVQQALRNGWRAVRRWQQQNSVAQASKNIKHHYDLSPEFYQLWLDPTMNYSCAYYTHPENSLEQAQQDKMRHIAAKLRLQPGMSVAEVGSGWGGLACYLARNFGVTITSVSLSPEQIRIARQRAIDMGVADKVTFLEQDYRHMSGTYDRVISIAMMEAIGIGNFDNYFAKLKSLMKPGGYGLVHAIGRMSPPGTTAPFIRKYIFPGGYVPAISEVFASTERTGAWVADCEVLRLHYYWTLKAWRENFAAIRPQAAAMYDERFCRMWEFYLISCELGFLHGSNMIYQILISDRRDDVPVLRDFIQDDERALAARGI
ncbi:MAG: class I SAM-dependent methyltransferase [Methylocystis sp.]|nr:class I SAM-dependent methyltransferase [Methylocystis sp.]